MNKTTGKFSPEIRARPVRLVPEHEGDHPSRWQAILSVAPKTGCSAQTLNERIKKSETDNGRRAGVPSDMAAKLKTAVVTVAGDTVNLASRLQEKAKDLGGELVATRETLEAAGGDHAARPGYALAAHVPIRGRSAAAEVWKRTAIA